MLFIEGISPFYRMMGGGGGGLNTPVLTITICVLISNDLNAALNHYDIFLLLCGRRMDREKEDADSPAR